MPSRSSRIARGRAVLARKVRFGEPSLPSPSATAAGAGAATPDFVVVGGARGRQCSSGEAAGGGTLPAARGAARSPVRQAAAVRLQAGRGSASCGGGSGGSGKMAMAQARGAVVELPRAQGITPAQNGDGFGGAAGGAQLMVRVSASSGSGEREPAAGATLPSSSGGVGGGGNGGGCAAVSQWLGRADGEEQGDRGTTSAGNLAGAPQGGLHWRVSACNSCPG
jgi:hypothetical protein